MTKQAKLTAFWAKAPERERGAEFVGARIKVYWCAVVP